MLCFLLLLVLGLLAFAAINTARAARSFQQHYSAIKAGDVQAIRPWMTIHMVSHIYYVPEDYLCHSLNMSNSAPLRHLTLSELAKRKRQPVDQVIHSLQHAILAYRKTHPHFQIPVPAAHSHLKRLSPTPWRTKY